VTHETDPIGTRIRAASESVSAPLALREQIGRAAPPRRRQPLSRRSLALVGGLLAVTATVAAFVAPGPPTVQAVAKAALHAPQRPAARGDDYLPGYTAVGARTDTVEGREAETVIYKRGAAGIHYTVVTGRPLDLPGTRREQAGKLELALARDGDVSLVVWHANGKTCILASTAVSPEDMARLLRPA
jgi:hypothetical protein